MGALAAGALQVLRAAAPVPPLLRVQKDGPSSALRRSARGVVRGPREKHLAAFSSCVAVTRCLTRNGGLGVARELIEAAQRGDVAAQEELVRRFEPLVQRVVWKLWIPRGCDREDIAQEARVGLLRAIRAWRPERGPFPAFADRCVSNQALLAIQAASARKHQVLSLAVSLDRRRDGSAKSADDGLPPHAARYARGTA